MLGLFGYGFAVGQLHIFPFSAIFELKKAAEDVLVLSGFRSTGLVRTVHRDGTGVTRNDAGDGSTDFILLNGFFDGAHELRLIHRDGSIVNRWPAQFSKIFPHPDHLPPHVVPKADRNAEVMGMEALPDGSVIFNFTEKGTVQLDRCGVLQWTIPRPTHHSLARAEDGGFWIPSARQIEKTSQFPRLKTPYQDETILKVSATGQILKEISVLELLFKNNVESPLFTNHLATIGGYGFGFTHLNDVEELSSEMAPAFPQFAAGDLLVSLRDLNLIMVVDSMGEKVKWHQIGPWIAQHDPDFLKNGRISVLNNNFDGTPDGSLAGGSNIVEIDPATRATWIRYGTRAGQEWYTEIRGRHQPLENGNVLISESVAGRAMEVDKNGQVVWEFINRYSDKQVALLNEAIRYPANHFNVKNWSCR